MPIVVEPVGAAILFDCFAPVTRSEAAAMRACGFMGVVRCLDTLTAPELQDLLAEDLGVLVYQAAHGGPWSPTATLGQADGVRAVAKAKAVGYGLGATIYNDLEDCVLTCTAADVAGYANAKFDVVEQGGWHQGEYIGFNVPVTSAQLYSMFHSKTYWHSGSNVPDVATRGYAMRQWLMDITYRGMRIDLSLAEPDKLGGSPYWMRAA
jgi:hypothetical protein